MSNRDENDAKRDGPQVIVPSASRVNCWHPIEKRRIIRFPVRENTLPPCRGENAMFKPLIVAEVESCDCCLLWRFIGDDRPNIPEEAIADAVRYYATRGRNT